VPGVRHSPAVTHNLARAVEGSANHLVSADRHLLDPAEYEGIQTVTPRDFVDILSLS
jgi:predicted nucleic acid-binding protein